MVDISLVTAKTILKVYVEGDNLVGAAPSTVAAVEELRRAIIHAERIKLADVKAGDVLVADGGFTCIEEGARLVVQEDSDGLFVPCFDGNFHHYLSGQLDFDDQEYLVGLARG